jgi:hypothetical protein
VAWREGDWGATFEIMFFFFAVVHDFGGEADGEPKMDDSVASTVLDLDFVGANESPAMNESL